MPQSHRLRILLGPLRAHRGFPLCTGQRIDHLLRSADPARASRLSRLLLQPMRLAGTESCRQFGIARNSRRPPRRRPRDEARQAQPYRGQIAVVRNHRRSSAARSAELDYAARQNEDATMMRRDIFTEEHEMFRAQVRRFVDSEIEPKVPEWNRAGMSDRASWCKMGAAGFLGANAPAEYGGGGVDFIYDAIVMEELSRVRAH